MVGKVEKFHTISNYNMMRYKIIERKFSEINFLVDIYHGCVMYIYFRIIYADNCIKVIY